MCVLHLFVAVCSLRRRMTPHLMLPSLQTRLSPEQYRVLRQKGTERAGTGEYNKHYKAGTYTCAGCEGAARAEVSWDPSRCVFIIGVAAVTVRARCTRGLSSGVIHQWDQV